MAKIEALAPIFIKWETGCERKAGEAVASYYLRAREYNRKVTGGTFVTKGDSGGLTVVGITIAAYKAYMTSIGDKTKLRYASSYIKQMDYATWLHILKNSYWDRCGADGIENQSIANLLVDFAWGSGTKTAIKKMQKLVGVTVDGVCGRQTVTAINSRNAEELFAQLMLARTDYIDAIIKAHPSYEKFRKGWMRRITSYGFSPN